MHFNHKHCCLKDVCLLIYKTKRGSGNLVEAEQIILQCSAVFGVHEPLKAFIINVGVLVEGKKSQPWL